LCEPFRGSRVCKRSLNTGSVGAACCWRRFCSREIRLGRGFAFMIPLAGSRGRIRTGRTYPPHLASAMAFSPRDRARVLGQRRDRQWHRSPHSVCGLRKTNRCHSVFWTGIGQVGYSVSVGVVGIGDVKIPLSKIGPGCGQVAIAKLHQPTVIPSSSSEPGWTGNRRALAVAY